ncbi:MAG TPA: hypothetical protein DCZ69_15070 [Syntrophobacteraceae bacterium]|jgi:hypothetical protein|nr:hypothetical protein [Syntrophobacteraceae bacterium]HBD09572.1 hypothetical protein [Syntrophobacteraceae bacterium]
MSESSSEYETKKRAIFEGMSQRGQKRILRLGYENWDPFQEPKDPREQILGTVYVKADTIVRQFYAANPTNEGACDFHKDLLDFAVSLLRGERRAQILHEFCNWFQGNRGE